MIGRHEVVVRVPDVASPVVGKFAYSASFVVEYSTDLLPNRALEGLEEARAHLEYHQALEAGWVAAARAAGCSWSMIGGVLGLSGDGARRKFSPLVES